MKNITKYVNNNLLKEIEQFISQNGKYACVAFAIGALYDLCSQALENGCGFEIKADKEGIVLKVEKRQEVLNT